MYRKSKMLNILQWTVRTLFVLLVYGLGCFYVKCYTPSIFILTLTLFFLWIPTLITFIIMVLMFIHIYQARKAENLALLPCKFSATHYYIAVVCSGILMLWVIPWALENIDEKKLYFFSQIALFIVIGVNFYMAWRRWKRAK